MTLHGSAAARSRLTALSTHARKLVRGMAATGVVLGLLWCVASPVTAAAAYAADGDEDGRIIARWGGPTVHVDWTGAPYKTVQASFIGNRVATPGDDVHRTLHVGNAGPSRAVMAISLDLSQFVPAVARNPDLADDIEIYWEAAGVRGRESFATLLRRNNGSPVIAEVQVARGATTAVTAGFRMPVETTTGRRDGRASTVLSFDVLVRMSGDTPDSGLLPETGLAKGVIAIALAGLLILLLGIALLSRSGRRCDWCTQHVRPEDGSIQIGRGRSKEYYCLGCGPRQNHHLRSV